MPGKKKANKAYITDITKTQYEGFVDEVNDFCTDVRALNLPEKIDAVMDELTAKRDAIEIPELPVLSAEATRAEKKNWKLLKDKNRKATEEKASLDKLVKQLTDIKTLADEFKSEQDDNRSSLKFLMDYENSDPKELRHMLAVNEYEYHSKIRNLYGLIAEMKKVFCGEANNGHLMNIRINLDSYNLSNEYKDYIEEGSVLSSVEDILTATEKLYTKTFTILAKADRHDKEMAIAKDVDYIRKNQLDYGRAVYYNPDFSLKNVKDAYFDRLEKKQTAELEEINAKKKLDTATRELKELTDKRNELMKKGPQSAEKKREAQKTYDRLKGVADTYNEVKKSLEDTTFKMEFPDLKELEASSGKTYTSLEELEAALRPTLDAMSMEEIKAKKDRDKVNSQIDSIINERGDKRLEEYRQVEVTRQQYIKYPEYGREILSKIKSLPHVYSIEVDIFNIAQLRAEITKKIHDKKGRSGIWYCIDAMLDHAEKFCPKEYRTMPLSEKVFKECEKKQAEYMKEADKDEAHKKVDEYQNKLTMRDALTLEINGIESVDKKNKSFWTKQVKDSLKIKKAQLETLNKEIYALKKDPINVEGAIKAKKLMDRSMEINDICFNYNTAQVDTYISVLKEYANNKKAYIDGNLAAQNSIYAKVLTIYNSIPEKLFSLQKSGKNTRNDSDLNKYLLDMKIAGKPADFKKAYSGFKKCFDEVKIFMNDASHKRVMDKLKECEDILKDTDYENRLEEYNRKITETAEKQGRSEIEYRTKKDQADAARQAFNDASKNFNDSDRFYKRKREAEKYDADNKGLDSAKYDIDEKGERYFRNIRKPFNDFYLRKGYSMKSGHKNSDQFKDMEDALSEIVLLPDSASPEAYRTAIEKIKEKAGTYIRVREAQFFVNKRNPMRKYRLSYAKSLVALCDEQLKDFKNNVLLSSPLNGEVKRYLSRTEKVKERKLSKQQEAAEIKAFNEELDAAKDQALKAYLDSPEYKAGEDAKKIKYEKDMKNKADEYRNFHKMKRNLGKMNVIIPNNNIDATIEAIKKRRDELKKDFEIRTLREALKVPGLPPQEKERIEQRLQGILDGKIEIRAEQVEIQEEENIIEQAPKEDDFVIVNREDIKEPEKKPKKKSKKQLKKEEEDRKKVDAQLDLLNSGNAGNKKKKKTIVINENNIVNENNIINVNNNDNDNDNENMRRSLGNSISSVDRVDMEIEEAYNPRHFEEANKNKTPGMEEN